MNTKQICILVVLCLAFVSAQDPPQDQTSIIRDNIIEKFLKKGNTKDLFKVWHFLYNRNKDYEVNSEKGINSYRTFKKNLKMVEEHNAKNLSYKLGINQFSDRTPKELMAYFNIREEGLPVSDFRKLAGFNLDDYDDTQETSEVVRNDPPRKNIKFNPIDYTYAFREVRIQGECNSCWTFSTTGAMEANYFIANERKGVQVERVYFSPQQLVDCDLEQAPYGGCRGGWMRYAINYYLGKDKWGDKKVRDPSPPQLDEDYKYQEKEAGVCKYNKNGKFVAKVVGLEIPTDETAEASYNVLVNGPIAGCINVQDDFWRYKSGIYNPTCDNTCHHAIVIMGYGFDKVSRKSYWKGRNSWGTTWGENGYFRVEDNHANGRSCMMADHEYNVRPIMDNY